MSTPCKCGSDREGADCCKWRHHDMSITAPNATGPLWPARTKAVEANNLAMWMAEKWELYASGDNRVRMYANYNQLFRVTRGVEILYEGSDINRAVSIYNENV